MDLLTFLARVAVALVALIGLGAVASFVGTVRSGGSLAIALVLVLLLVVAVAAGMRNAPRTTAYWG